MIGAQHQNQGVYPNNDTLSEVRLFKEVKCVIRNVINHKQGSRASLKMF